MCSGDVLAVRFGYVHFGTNEEAADALKKEVEIHGHSLYLDVAMEDGMVCLLCFCALYFIRTVLSVLTFCRCPNKSVSRDITIFSCFSCCGLYDHALLQLVFYWSTVVPTLVQNSLFFVY